MIDRRAFLQRLGAMAAAGTLAPSVAASVLQLGDFVAAGMESGPGSYTLGAQKAEMYTAHIDDLLRGMDRAGADHMMMPPDPRWHALVEEARRHHPELLEATA